MLFKADYVSFTNDLVYFLVSLFPILDGFSLYSLSGAIIAIGLIPLISFMSGKRSRSKILDIGSKMESIVGGAAGVAGVIQNSGNKGESSGNKGGKDNKGSGDNKGGDNKGGNNKGGNNKGGDSGGKK